MTADLAVLARTTSAPTATARSIPAGRVPDENVLQGLASLRRALEQAADRSRPLAG